MMYPPCWKAAANWPTSATAHTMYRQKGTLQNLENIGWAKPGCECLYNIYIMEEIHTILSAGAGGSTKLVIPGQRRGKIERIFNFNILPSILTALRRFSPVSRAWRTFMRATQQRKRFVSRELVALAANQPQAFADYSEGQYRAQIESIADEVLSSGRHIVMLTGPSAAGKTTSAHKIADAIAARGCRSAVVSLDDFYAGAGRYPAPRRYRRLREPGLAGPAGAAGVPCQAAHRGRLQSAYL